ncbi:MAG: phosphatidylglycerol lysyltransferase domain-containing protein [Tannerellaceae bacterium]|nr:phosphatidylglycerol lysyltransferase domain-containing protein [Tannerellaceae bacterium]
MLEFSSVTIESLKKIQPFFKTQRFRTCDYSSGGLFMWVNYFGYEYCIFENTLFIKGNFSKNSSIPSFAYPIGSLPIRKSIEILKEYTVSLNTDLILSAVPDSCLLFLTTLYNCQIVWLEDWSDYLFEANALKSLAGRKYNKKRNRVNKFLKENPDHTFYQIDVNNLFKVKAFFQNWLEEHPKENSLFGYENEQTLEVLNNYDKFPFVGGFLEVEGKVIAFTIGEMIKDTLYVHIEKAKKEIDGSYEIINNLFINHAMSINKNITFVNREEDVGDLGLRRAKLAYHPIQILNKYNVKINP